MAMDVTGPSLPAARFSAPSEMGSAARAIASGLPGSAPPAGAGSAAPPKDASLWDLLTPEERAFFAEQASLGPLTYRPGGARAGHPAVPTGQRIDVRG